MRLAPIVLLALALAACERREPESSPPAAAPPAESVSASSSVAVASVETSSSSTSSAARGALVLSPDGIGPLKIGMTFAEAEAALGAPFVVKDDYGNGLMACNYGSSTALPGVSVMVDGGKVVRFDTRDGAAIRSDRGIAEGDPATAVTTAYPAGLAKEAHKYSEAPAHYLEWFNADGGRGIRYEVGQDGKVSNMYAGAMPNVGYVEGCS